jgi:thiol-disulfide isomerase/thioredoxin
MIVSKTFALLMMRALRLAWPWLFGLYGGIALSASAAPGGEALDLTAYRGKIVVVDFWASWCTPCRHSIPWLNDMQARYGQRGLVVVGVNTDPVRADADRFMGDVPVHFPLKFDPEGRLATLYKLPGMPTSLIFDREGRLLRTRVGFREAERAQREAEIVGFLENGK